MLPLFTLQLCLEICNSLLLLDKASWSFTERTFQGSILSSISWRIWSADPDVGGLSISEICHKWWAVIF